MAQVLYAMIREVSLGCYDIHLSSHGIEMPSVLRFADSSAVEAVVDRLELNLLGHVLQEVRHWLSMPTSTAEFVECEMATEGCRAAYCVRVRLEFLVWNGFFHGNLSPVSMTDW